jgi:predicted flap endonuclease-1-like 5' DNA nuclease
MMYLLGEIFVCVLVAGLLGLAVGWLLRNWQVGDVEADWRSRLGEADDRVHLVEEGSKARIAGLYEDLENSNARITRLTATRETAEARLAAMNGERDDLVATIRRIEKEFEATRQRHDEARVERDDAVRRLEEFEGDLLLATERASQVETDWRARWETQGAQLAELSVAFSTTESELETLRSANRDLEHRLDACQSGSDGLAAELRARNAEIQQERLRAQELEKRTPTSTDLAPRVEALESKLKEARRTAAASERNVADLRAELDHERSDLTDRIAKEQTAVQELQQRCEHLEAQLRSSSARNDVESRQSSSTFGNGQQPSVSTASPASRQRDDLKKIHGIGPKLERLLNSRGIYRFSDIAGWTAQDIESFSRSLDVFPGRINRDDWVLGARREHARKYGNNN